MKSKDATADWTSGSVSWAERAGWAAVLGVVVGVLFLAASGLKLKWFLMLLSLALVFLLALAVRDRKAYFLALLTLSTTVGISLHLGIIRGAPIYVDSAFIIHVSYIPLGALFVIWGCRSVAAQHAIELSRTGLLPLAGLLVASGVSLLRATDPQFGFFNLFSLFFSVLIFLYMSSQVRDCRELHLVLVCCIVATACQGLIAIFQYATGEIVMFKFFGGYSGPELAREFPSSIWEASRVGGTIGSPNNLALFFDLMIPISFSLLFSPLRRRTRLLLGIAILCSLIGLSMTLSRGGMMVVAVGLLVIVFERMREKIGALRVIVWVPLVAAALCIILLGTPNRIQRRFFKDDYQEALGRIPLIKVAFNILRDRPVAGIGLNNYHLVAPAYDNTPERIYSRWINPVHNNLLYIWVETGLFGLVFYLLFLLTVFRRLSASLSAEDPLVSRAGLGLLVGLAAYLAHSLIEAVNWTRRPFLWLLFGLAIAIGRMGRRTEAPARSSVAAPAGAAADTSWAALR